MVLEGLTKAVKRAPHRLYGHQTKDTPEASDWEADLKGAATGLSFLITETTHLTETWKKTFLKQLAFVEGVALVNSPVLTQVPELTTVLKEGAKEGLGWVKHGATDAYKRVERKVTKEVTPPPELGSPSVAPLSPISITLELSHHTLKIKDVDVEELEEGTGVSPVFLEQLAAYRNLTVLLALDVALLNYKLELTLKAQCKEMKSHLHGLGTLLTKRRHKKIDRDRFLNTKTSLEQNQEADPVKKAEAEQHFAEAEALFLEVDARLRLLMPEGLGLLSEFLNKVVTKIFSHTLAVFKRVVEELTAFGVYYGLLADAEFAPYLYEAVVALWKEQMLDVVAQAEVLTKRESSLERDKNAKGGVQALKHTVDGAASSVRKLAEPLHTPHAPRMKTGILDLAADPIRSFTRFNDPLFLREDAVIARALASPPVSPVRLWALPGFLRGASPQSQPLRSSPDSPDYHSRLLSPIRAEAHPRRLSGVHSPLVSLSASWRSQEPHSLESGTASPTLTIEDGLSRMYNVQKFEVTESPLAVRYGRSRLNTYPMLEEPKLSPEQVRVVIGEHSLTYKQSLSRENK